MDNEIIAPVTRRSGNWLPSNQEHLEDWLEVMTQMVEARGVPAPFHPVIQKILMAWCEFLNSEASLYVLNDSPQGWKCDAAQQAINIDQFQYDPADEYWGFKSWNDFFIRKFKDGQRPIAESDNNKVIVSACESTPYKISANVKNTTSSGSNHSPTPCKTCWPMTKPWTNLSAGRSIKPSSAPSTTTAGTVRFPVRLRRPL